MKKKVLCCIMALAMIAAMMPLTVSAATVKLTTPKIKSVKVISSTSLKVSWGKVKNATKYVVGRFNSKPADEDNITDADKIIRVKGKLSCTDKSLKTGKKYYYMVMATKGKIKSGESAVKAKTVKMAPATKITLKITTGKNTTGTWGSYSQWNFNAMDGVTGYELWRSSKTNDNYKLITKRYNNNVYTSIKMTSGQVYYSKVRAFTTKDGKTTYGKWSNVVKFTAK